MIVPFPYVRMTVEIIYETPDSVLKWTNPATFLDLAEKEITRIHFLKLAPK